ncbi:MAG: hypothetical protein JEZ06_22810 [Anaerolineaceae bacterium]|nr:hypothetical protein [Anaerolineaceae bacterium]
MSTQLLKTKLHPPAVYGQIIKRTNLLQRLEANLDKQITLVAAPAGFGKSTLISSCLEFIPRTFGWFSLDTSDNDPALFWAYLFAALKTSLESSSINFPEQGSLSNPAAVRNHMTQWINTLSGQTKKIILVLDDYHNISNPQIHADLTYLIEHQPGTLHIILITRSDPPLPIARLRGQRALTEFRAAELRFNPEEIETFMNTIMSLDLSGSDLATLGNRTEGWIIGLQLSAIAMQKHSNKSAFIAAFSGGHQYILEYLTDEIFNNLNIEQQQFMLSASILERFCAPLCEQFVDNIDCNEMLSRFQKENLFIISLDEEQKWFRFNHLFVDLLRNLLRKVYSKEKISALHLKASQWFQDNGYQIEAIEHILKAYRFDQAAVLIESTAGKTMMHGQLTTLLRWINVLPEEILSAHPRLRMIQAWALSLSGKQDIAEDILVEIQTVLESQPETIENKTLRGELAAMLTGVLIYSQEPERIKQAGLSALTFLPQESFVSRSRVHIALGTVYAYSDEMQTCIHHFQKARNLAIKTQNPFLTAAATEMLAGLQIYHLGKLTEAEKNLKQIIDMTVTDDGKRQPYSGNAFILLSEIYLERNLLSESSQHLVLGQELLQHSGIAYNLTHACCLKARLSLALGDRITAINVLQEAMQITQDSRLMHILVHNLSCQSRSAIQYGDLKLAYQWAIGEKSSLPENLPAYLHEVQQIALARVSIAKGDLQNTLDILQPMVKKTRSAGRNAHLLEIFLLQALALFGLGKHEKALKAFYSSLEIAEPEGIMRIYLDAGEPIQRVLQLAKENKKNNLFIEKLITDFEFIDQKDNKETETGEKPSSQSELFDALSQREIEVLQLITDGHSNQQIADLLVVSLNTIKKHTSNIYSKMGVRNRTQAIALGRRIKIIT